MITNIKRLAVFLLVLGCFFNSVHADDDDVTEFYNSLLPNFQKMTPEASALGQYGNYTASDYTGVPNISIPLFSVGSNGFSIPIELNYDASGIKVEQQATYVGLGWNFMLGGKISQIVCGQNDNCQTGFYVNTITNQDLLKPILPSIGYFSSLVGCVPIVRFPGVPIAPEVGTPLPIDNEEFNILQSVTIGAKVPDVYQASFCGHNVSFVIDPFNSKAKIIGNDATNYQIEIKMENAAYLLRRIEITDDHGLKYIFIEMPQNSPDDNALYNLSKIENAAGQCLVEFRYFKEKIKLLKSYYESKGKIDSDYGKPIALTDIHRKFLDRNYPLTLVYEAFEYYPDTIITQNEIVTFAYSDRDDVKGAKQLDKVTVKSNSDGTFTIHSIDFNYDYLSESSYDSELCSRYGYTNAYSYKRLKLKEVTVDGKKYSFDYYGSYLPARLSLGQDFWGYYNGLYNKNGFCASPKYRCTYNGILDSVVTVGDANRYASTYYCNSGMLKRIVYPTGGYTLFTYELNHFDDVSNMYYYPSATSNVKYVRTETCGSGYNGRGYKTTPDSTEFDVGEPVKVEISSSTPYLDRSSSSYAPNRPCYYNIYFSIIGRDDSGKKVFERYYTKYNDKQDFKESFELPKGHYVLTSQFGSVENGLMIGGSIRVAFPPELIVDESIADASGKSVGGGLRIKKIENYDSNGSFLGSTQYRYEGGKLLIPTVQAELIPMKYVVSKKMPHLYIGDIYVGFLYDCQFYFVTSHPTYPAICSLGSSNVGYSKVIKEYYDKDKKLMSYDIEKYYNSGYYLCHNMFSVNSDGMNGKLIESATYSKDDVLMHKVDYSYTTIGKNPSKEDMVFFPWARCLDMSPGNSDMDVKYKYSLYPKYPICVLPKIVTETEYVNGKAMIPVTTSYEYRSSNYQAKIISKSNGYDSVCTKIWYPIDSIFLNKANNALKTELKNKNYNPDIMLSSKHCISEKTIVEKSHNGNITDGYLNLYKELPNGLPVIDRCYSIQPSQTQILEMEVMDYDSYGNIREYRKKDGTPVSLVWSYNHQCPVMEIVGKGHNDFNNEILSLIANIEGKTNVLPSDIRNLYNSLTKQKYQGVSIKAYIYSPWHTVSSIIQPNGYETKYSYDSYGRLEKASDASDNILQKYIYNYKK